MKVSTHGIILIIISILVNNLLWLYASDDSDMSNSKKPILLADSVNSKGKFNPIENNLSQNIPITGCTSQKNESSKRNKWVESRGHNTKATDNKDTPFTVAMLNLDVPVELSQDFLFEHSIDREDFFYANSERKLDTIQTLSAQGDDLKLIREIMKAEVNSDLRVEALTRLNNEDSYVATRTLLEALDDPAEEVVLAALNTIALNGDRTLLPLLNEKMNLISGRAIRDKYEKSIHRLKYSVTMGMDNIAVE